MKEMIVAVITLVIGFVLLIKGADFFVEGSASIARRLRVPSLIIGMTIVAMGTSLPECAVSVTASITNNNTFVIPDLEISVNFYKDGKIVDTAKDGHDAILPGYTVVSDFDSYEIFDDAKYDLELDWSNSYKNHSDKVKADYNINSSKDVLVTVTNNNDYEIEEIEVIVVFYNKDGKLLGTSYAEDIYHVAAGKSKTESLYLKEYSLQNQIDSVKIYINQAHTF